MCLLCTYIQRPPKWSPPLYKPGATGGVWVCERFRNFNLYYRYWVLKVSDSGNAFLRFIRLEIWVLLPKLVLFFFIILRKKKSIFCHNSNIFADRKLKSYTSILLIFSHPTVKLIDANTSELNDLKLFVHLADKLLQIARN